MKEKVEKALNEVRITNNGRREKGIGNNISQRFL